MSGAPVAHRARVPGLNRAAAGLDIVRLALWYFVFAGLKHVVSLRTLVRLARRTSGGPARAATTSVARVVRLQRLLGEGRGDCLQAALVVYRELSRAGREPYLVAGFTRVAGRTTGHAWVEVNGAPLTESAHDLRHFERALAFGPDGLPAATGRG